MPRPIRAHIHGAALRDNLQRIRAAAPHSRIWSVVKANAYGHKIENVLDGLRASDGFAVLDLAEAQKLRDLQWRGPILLLEGIFEPRDLELCSRLDLWHVVHEPRQIDWLVAHKTPTPQQVFLKINTGMNRLGFAPEAAAHAWLRLAALPQVESITLMTHFSNADVAACTAHTPTLAQQWRVFEGVNVAWGANVSASNSAAILRQSVAKIHEKDATSPNSQNWDGEDWVRAGIALYGCAPDWPQCSAADWGLRAAMSLRTRLLAVQHVDAGAAVGYGGTFVADAPMRVGVVACGYADGYPRSAASGQTPVLVGGHRARLIGRVSMDMLCVDVSHLPQAEAGSAVTLWGEHQPQAAWECAATLPVEEVAASAGTIGYELLCAVAARVPFEVDA